jgi:cytochrome c peroxidase
MRLEGAMNCMARRVSLVTLSYQILAAYAALAAVLIVSVRPVAAQTLPGAASTPKGIYLPYPAGVVPTDLAAETDKVRREIAGIEKEALAEWHALGPLTPSSNPPVLAGSGMRAVQVLGKLENFDEQLSVNKNEACAFCHMPYTGFTGPIPSLNRTTVAYPGSFHYRFGKRKPQSYTYSPHYPVLQYNATQANFYAATSMTCARPVTS